MSTENLWNDTIGGNRSTRGGESQCHCSHYKSDTDRPGIEPELPRVYVRGVRKPCKACQDGRKSREDSKPASCEYEELPTPPPLRPVRVHFVHVTMINSRYVDRAF